MNRVGWLMPGCLLGCLFLNGACERSAACYPSDESVEKTLEWFVTWKKPDQWEEGDIMRAIPRIATCDANERWRKEFCRYLESIEEVNEKSRWAVIMAGFCQSDETKYVLPTVLLLETGLQDNPDWLRREAFLAMLRRNVLISKDVALVLLKRSADPWVRCNAVGMTYAWGPCVGEEESAIFELAAADPNSSVRGAVFDKAPVDSFQMRNLARRWLADRIRKAPADWVAGRASEDINDIGECIDYLITACGMGESPVWLRGTQYERAMRILYLSGRLEKEVERFENQVHEGRLDAEMAADLEFQRRILGNSEEKRR